MIQDYHRKLKRRARRQGQTSGYTGPAQATWNLRQNPEPPSGNQSASHMDDPPATPTPKPRAEKKKEETEASRNSELRPALTPAPGPIAPPESRPEPSSSPLIPAEPAPSPRGRSSSHPRIDLQQATSQDLEAARQRIRALGPGPRAVIARWLNLVRPPDTLS